MYKVNTKKNKDVRINLKAAEELRQEFRLVAELRGSTMSNLLHQFIVATVWEEKKKHPEAFAGIRIVDSTPEETDSDPSKDDKITPRKTGKDQ